VALDNVDVARKKGGGERGRGEGEGVSTRDGYMK